MECIMPSTIRLSRSTKWECALPYGISSCKLRTRRRWLVFIHHPSSKSSQCCRCTSMVYPVKHLLRRHSSGRICATSVSLDEKSSSLSMGEQFGDTDELGASEEQVPKCLGSDELKSLLADSERAKLIRKLSDANQYNRFLKRQLQSRDDDLENFKSDLSLIELELQALVGLAQEVANCSAQLGSRKINGKYIQSHLLSRLEVVHKKVKEQIKEADSLKLEEVTLYWVGMAESVQVMGSFDGWSQGEALSPEYLGHYSRFSTTLKLRPGRYEIKFLVDGEWQLSPEFPTVGEGMMQNNLLVVKQSPTKSIC